MKTVYVTTAHIKRKSNSSNRNAQHTDDRHVKRSIFIAATSHRQYPHPQYHTHKFIHSLVQSLT
eukprot:m.270316 g.270316  ORF g.270316 m.270316 type:complete len:64 (-) comp89175_c0_seq1:41-232(-)